SQFVIAVFDEWDAVERLLASLGSDKIGRFGALLHTRTDEPPMLAVSWLVQDMRELHFAASRSRVRCTAGVLAAQLAMRSAAGASDLAHALRGWVSPEQAKELQSHVERGRLMLWLQPSRPEDFETVCAQMVQTSPHLVELSDAEFNQ
ncbi:MAG: hypothetical protein WAN86_12895, partial [Hyphomicrobiaceae bacterium]